MKKVIIFMLTLCIAVMLGSCGGTATSNVTETDHSKLNGIYVDKSYTDEDNKQLKLVYVFYDVFTDDQNLEVSSRNSEITINGENEYTSDKFNIASRYIESYYYSSYIEEVYIGNTLKVLSTFEIPEGDLTEGRQLEIAPYGIPETDKFKIKTDDIVYCDTLEEIAEVADPEGYASYKEKQEDADKETVKKVKADINGYYWRFFVNNTTYKLEFFAPDKFEVSVSGLNVNNGGKYKVKKGFISCTYDSNGTTVDIPWKWGDSGIELDTAEAFDVHR